MSNVVEPSDQKRYIDPYQIDVYQFNTSESKVYISRYVNYLLNAVGNNIAIKGLNCILPTISEDKTSVNISVEPGYMIIDSTLIHLPTQMLLSYTDLNLIPYENIGGKLIIHANYQYLNKIEKNTIVLKLSYVTPNGNTILPSGWQILRDNIVLGIFDYTMDENNNIITFEKSDDTIITILGKEYTVYGFSTDNIHFNRIFEHLNTIEVSTLRVDQLKPAEEDSTSINVTTSYPGLIPKIPVSDKILYFRSDGTWGSASGEGLGNVAGPDTHNDKRIPYWDGTDTKRLSGGYVLDILGEDIIDNPNHIPSSKAIMEYVDTNTPDASAFNLSNLSPSMTNNLELNVNTDFQGLMPQLPNDSKKVLDGTGIYRQLTFDDIEDKLSLDKIYGFTENNEALLATTENFGLVRNLNGDSSTFYAGDGTFVSLPISNDYILDELGPPTDITRLNASILSHGLCPKLSGNSSQFLSGLGTFTTITLPTADNFKLDDLGLPDDNTDLNASSSSHGLLQKLNNNPQTFLNGQHSWAIPKVEYDTTPVLGGDMNANNKLIYNPRFRGYVESYYSNGDLSGSVSLNANYNVHTMTVTGIITNFTFANFVNGYSHNISLRITNGGNYAITWAAHILWEDDIAPTLTTNGVDWMLFISLDGGTTVYGFLTGVNVK